MVDDRWRRRGVKKTTKKTTDNVKTDEVVPVPREDLIINARGKASKRGNKSRAESHEDDESYMADTRQTNL